MEGREWASFKESIMEAAFRADANSRFGNGMFERDALTPEAGININNSDEQRRFALAIGELLDEGRLIRETKDASSLSVGTG